MNRNVPVPFLGEGQRQRWPLTRLRAVVTSGTKQGTYVGKVAVRTRGSFNITTAQGVVTDIHHRFCVLIARSDGYTYQQRKEAALPPRV